MNVLLVGEESAGVQALKLLRASGHRLVGVAAAPAPHPAGHLTVWQLAERMGCRRWPAQQLTDPAFAGVMREERVDLLLNVHSLFVLPGPVVEAPTIGAFNVHPGPLPRYAGLNAPSWAIYHGERRHGVTIHRMVAGIDTGPIAYQTLLDVAETDTGYLLSAKCARAGLELIARLLETAAIDPAAIPSLPQDRHHRTYFGRDTPQDGWLVWSHPARAIVDFVRAADYSPFPSPWRTPRSRLGNREVGFMKVAPTGRPADAEPGRIARSSDGTPLVAAADQRIAVARVVGDGTPVSLADALPIGERLTWHE